jgi:hypothetical protein
MDDEDFWDDLMLGQQSRTASSLDTHLQARESELAGKGLRVMTDKGRAAAALPTPVQAGTRVSFVVNLGSVLSYPDPPSAESQGTVVMVRTAEGDQTGMDDLVFVKFDDGKFIAAHREHLRRAPKNKTASSFAQRISSLGDLTGFMRWSGDDELVHKSTKDLWSFQQTDQGDYIIARLFDDTGEPLKV